MKQFSPSREAGKKAGTLRNLLKLLPFGLRG
jgi:hypothetical protein